MTTTTPATRGRSIAQHAVAAGERRRRRWAGTWRAALRLAWRDALRHRAATALILVMVGLPVLLITGAATYLSTTDVTAAESVPVALGRAQAKLFDGSGGPVAQSPDGRQWSSGPYDEAATMPGHTAGEPWTAAQLTGLTGGTVVPVGYPRMLATTAAGAQRIRALAIEPSALPAAGIARLESGRWPASDGEVAVTATGLAAGLPRSGSLELGGSGHRATVQVVGVVAARDASFAPVQLVAGSGWLDPNTWYGSEQASGYLLLRDAPVSWDEVQRLNRYGLMVLSRAVVADPPTRWDRSAAGGTDGYGTAIVVLVCAALVLETTLLAGPAFAVSAARRRRSLALLAGNGADRGQLVRFVCAQGLALGALAAVGGLGLGLLVGWASTRVLAAVDPAEPTPPFGTSAGFVLAVTLAAVVAATVAAAVPARGAVRLALHPRTRSSAAGDGSVPRLPTIVGVVGVVLGAAALAVAYGRLSSSLQVFAMGLAAAVLVLGVLLLLPLVLVGVGRLGGRLPVGVRLGVRDASRERGRSGPAVAAVLVATSVLTILTTAIGSTEARDRRDHTPVAPFGHGVIWNGGASDGSQQVGAALADRVRQLHPGWTVRARGTLGGPEYREGTGVGTVAAIVPPGCRAAVATGNPDEVTPGSAAGRCQRAGSGGTGVAVAESATMTAWTPLRTAERAVLDRGGVLVTDPTLLRGDEVELAAATFRRPAGDDRRVSRVVRLPALVVPPDRLNALLGIDPRNGSPSAGVLPPAAATAAGLPVVIDRYDVADPGGPISVADEDEVNRLADDTTGTQLVVERGPTSSSATVLAVLSGVAVLLVLVATLMSVALTHVERRADLATLAAVGATSAFRRRLAGGHAVVLAGLGVGLGVLVGLAPGVLYGLVLTTDHDTASAAAARPPVLEVPWSLLAAVLLGVPLLAAAPATLLVRPAPVLTRRLT